MATGLGLGVTAGRRGRCNRTGAKGTAFPKWGSPSPPVTGRPRCQVSHPLGRPTPGRSPAVWSRRTLTSPDGAAGPGEQHGGRHDVCDRTSLPGLQLRNRDTPRPSSFGGGACRSSACAPPPSVEVEPNSPVFVRFRRSVFRSSQNLSAAGASIVKPKSPV